MRTALPEAVSYVAEFRLSIDDFYHANDVSGIAWNAPEIGLF